MFTDDNTQSFPIPMSLEPMIPEGDLVRIVNDTIDRLSERFWDPQPSSAGRPAYPPQTMTKIVIYAYAREWYSARVIEQALRENLRMVWLAGGRTPNFRTINRFRSQQMQERITPLFHHVVQELLEEQLITGDHYFLDGTKIEADANRYTFVWRKSTVRYEQRLQERLAELWQEVVPFLSLPDGQERIDADTLRTVAIQMAGRQQEAEQRKTEAASSNERREAQATLRWWRKRHRQIERNYLPRLVKYERYLATFDGRNSFSKTDPDATFMRMKDDHMGNGQLKPGYNIQMGTENQYIVGYTVHPNPTDTRCLPPHLTMLHERPLPFPGQIIADAGYGSEPNYLTLIEEAIPFLIPYPRMRQEQTRAFQRAIHPVQNWTYDEKDDLYWCPNHRKVRFQAYERRTDRYGYQRDLKRYESEDCSECPLKPQCTTAEGNRQVRINPVYEEGKAIARRALTSDEGASTYARRKIEAESVFGHLKANRRFRRFALRGTAKVTTEFGLLAVAHNLRKKAESTKKEAGETSPASA